MRISKPRPEPPASQPIDVMRLEERTMYSATPFRIEGAEQPLNHGADMHDVAIDHIEALLHHLQAEFAGLDAFDDWTEATLRVESESLDHSIHIEHDEALTVIHIDAHQNAHEQAASGNATEVLVVDTSVEGYEDFVRDILDHVQPETSIDIVLLDRSTDGVSQLSTWFSTYDHDLRTVHLVSHGMDGGLWLGNNVLSAQTLEFYEPQLAGWGSAFAEGADLLIYGCNVGASKEGTRFLDHLATTLDVDIAASVDLTGHTDLGGDWDLEYRHGTVDSEIVFSRHLQSSWQGSMGTVTVSNTLDSTNGNTSSITALIASDGGDGISLREAILAANNTAGADIIAFNISGTGVHTITPGSSLTITEAVTIDATTDDSFAANSSRPAIILDGNNSFNGDGLVLTGTADGTTIRGFVIRDFSGNGIEIQANSNGNTIAGNYIGAFHASGTDAGAGEANLGSGINLSGSNNTIGGTKAADRNVIAGNVAGNGLGDHDSIFNDITISENVTTNVGLTANGDAAGVRHELVILDSGVQDSAGLLELLLSQQEQERNLEFVVIHGERDGLEQISEILTGYHDLDAVHLLSHGTAKGMQLGSTWLDHQTINDYSDVIHDWKNAFSTNGDLLLYGCDLAANDAGRLLVDTLGQWTGTDVAASTDLTGFAMFFGDWQLEYQVGHLETSIVASEVVQAEWEGLMAVSLNSTSSAATSGTASSLTWSHTIDNGTNRILTVSLSLTAGQATSVTYGGTAMTLVGRYTGIHSHTSEIWQLLAPTVGTANIEATFNTTTQALGGGVAFNDVDQSSPTGTFQGASADSGTASVTVTSAVGDMVIDTLFVDLPTTVTALTGQTENWELANGRTGGGSMESGAASVVMSWTISNPDEWNIAAVSIRQNTNEAPVLDNSGTMSLTTITEDDTNNSGNTVASIISSAGGDRITDADSGDAEGIAITAVTSGNGSWEYSTDGGGNWLAVGAVSENSALLLRSTDHIRFVPNGLNATSGDITFRAWDQTAPTAGLEGTKIDVSSNGGSTPFSTATEVAAIVVTAVNDAPVVGNTSNISLTATDENSIGTSTLVSDILISAVQSDVDSGAASGIAVISTTGNGRFQYSTDGVSWTNFGIVSSSNGLLLTSTSYVRYAPDGNNGETASFAFKAWDQTTGTASTGGTASYADPGAGGGTTAYSTANGTVQQIVTAVADLPQANDDDGHLNLDGADDFVLIADSVSLTMTNTMTMEVWINPDSSTNTSRMIINKEGEYELAVFPDNTLRWAIASTNPGWTWVNTGHVVTNGVWTHVAVTFDNGTIQTYVNGNVVHSFAGSGPIGDQHAALDELRIGGRSNNPSNQYFDGSIDDVRIWNVARNQAQIQASMDQTLAGNEAGLVAYYRFNETSGTAVVDLSSFGNNGTLTNGVTRVNFLIDEDTPLVVSSINGVLANDRDGDGDTLTVTALNGNGLAIGSATSIGSGALVTLNSDGSFTYNANGAFDYLASGATATDSFTYTVSDGNGNTTTSNVIVNITGLNDAPVLDNGGTMTLTSISEDATTNGGNTVASIVASAGGNRITDVDVGAVEGIAVTALSSGNGSWQYSLNGGTSWQNVGEVSTSSALLLRDTDLLRFMPNGTIGSTADVTFRAWDRTSGTVYTRADVTASGGTTAFSSTSETASIVISDVNDGPSFATGDGMISPAFSLSIDTIYSMTVQSDGKILAVGSSYESGTYDFAIARFNADGSIDTGFGGGDGLVSTSFGLFDDIARSVSVLADGSILVVGSTYTGTSQDVALAKYNSDGTLDTSFGGGDGMAKSGDSSNDEGYSAVIQSDGKILVGGKYNNLEFGLLRFHGDGSLDTTFGTSGVVSTDFTGGNDGAYSIALQNDGRIVLGGFAFTGTSFDFAVARYIADGTPDTSFSGDGKETVDLGTNSSDTGYSVALQADNKILIAGWSDAAGNNDFALVRLNSDGSLDSTFSGDGKVTTSIGSGSDLGLSVATQADGKILVAGTSSSNSGNFGIVRYNSDGNLDASFGTGGIVDTNIGGSSQESANTVVVQSDGKILVGGSTTLAGNVDFAVARYSSSGTLDTRFDLAETLGGTVNYNEGGAAVVLDSDVSIFDDELTASNNFSGATLTLARNGGANAEDVFLAIGTLSVLTESTSLVVGGTTVGTVITNSSGTLVLSFNANATNALVNSVLRQIAYGNTSDTPPASTQVNWTFNDGNTGGQGTGGALTATGSVTVNLTATNDAPTLTTISSPVVTVNEDTQATITFADLQSSSNDSDVDGTVIAFVVKGVSSGTLLIGTSSGTATAWAAGTNDTIDATHQAYWTGDLNANGTLNAFTVVAKDDGGLESATPVQVQLSVVAVNEAPTFGVGDGAVATNFGSTDYAYAVATQLDGKILLAGSARVGTNDDFAVARYNIDGSLDTSFGVGGKITTDFTGGSDWAHGVAVQADGKIVVTGRAHNGSNWDVAVARYNADGSLDATFGGGTGKMTVDFGSGNDVGNFLELQSDGKIVVSARARIGTNDDFAVLRFNTDGTLDTSFGGTGKVTTAIGSGHESGQRMTIQSDGKIVVSGYTSNGANNDIAVVRYNTDGSLDTSFGGTGKVTTAIGTGEDSAGGVAVQNDGKIVVGGYSFNGANNDVAVVRYNADGTLDTSFGSGGVITTAIGTSNDQGASLRLQTDGKIVVGGLATISGSLDFAAVRYNADGTLDSSFGSGGITTVAASSGTDYAIEMSLQADGKILLAGRSHNGTNDDFAVVRLGTDGTADVDFDQSTLNGLPTFTEDGSPVVLDNDVQVFDTELSAIDNFNGATLTLARNGGANAQDIYSATGTLSALTEGAGLVVSGMTVGTVTTNSLGTLVLTFNANASNALVNSVMQQIAYSNNSDTPPATVQINWTFNDNNNGAQGTGGALSANGSTTVSITATNDEQVLATNTGAIVAENGTANFITPVMLQTTDVDNTSGQIVYTITSATSNGTLRRSGIALSVGSTFTQADVDAGVVTYDHNGSETNSDSFSFSVHDGGGTASTGTFGFTITPVNDNTPVITSNGGGLTAAINVAENSTAVTTVTATDGDLPGQTLTYAITGGADLGLFAIDSNTGVLSLVSGRNREAHTDADSNGIYQVRVQVSDGTLVDFQDISVTITDVDEFDVTAPNDTNAAANAVNENVAPGTTVGVTANAFDLDATNNTITYSLTSNPGGLFQIDANTGVVTTAAAIDREIHGASRLIAVQATSSDGSTQTQSFNITINDLDEFNVSVVTDTNAGANSVAENATIGTTVGITAFAEDLDATNNAMTYTLDDDAGGLFAIDSTTGVVTVAGAIDRETAASYNITVRATSTDTSTTTRVFTIAIGDIDEFNVTAPTDSNATANAVNENVVTGTTAGVTANAFDLDATSNTITYSLTSNPGGLFQIDTNTGVVTTAAAIDRETHGGTRSITVQATSSDGSNTTQTFNITINDLDEFDVGPVTDTNVTANSVAENVSTGTAVGITASASDADATNNTVTYTLDDSAGGRFAIDANTGVVTVAGAIDREAAGSWNITIRATSSDGSFNTATHAINITDVDEFDVTTPTDTNGSADIVSENAANGTVVGTVVSATDADATSNTITYSLDDNAGGRFAVDGVTGVVTVANGTLLDYETAASHGITLRATSADGSFSTHSLIIQLNNVNEGPTGLSPGVFTLAENTNATGGVDLGTLFTVDPDAGGSFSYSVVGGSAATYFSLGGADGDHLLFSSAVVDFEGTNSYSVMIRATDQGGLFVERMVTLQITDANDAPVAVHDAYSLQEGGTLFANTGGLTANDTDQDGDPLTVRLLSGPTHGTVVLQSSGAFSYVHDGTETASDSFVYEVQDGQGGVATGTVMLTIAPLNDAPTGIADNYRTVMNPILFVNPLGILSNDTDAEGNILRSVLVTTAQHGVLSLGSNGGFTYLANPGFYGTDQFEYQVFDGQSTSGPVTVTVDVQALAFNPGQLDSANEDSDTSDEESAHESPDGVFVSQVSIELISVGGDGESNTSTTTDRRGAVDVASQVAPRRAGRQLDPKSQNLQDISLVEEQYLLQRSQLLGGRDDVGSMPEVALSDVEDPILRPTELLPFDPTWFADQMRLASAALSELPGYELLATVTIGATTSLSIGYLAWSVRSAYLLGGFLASAPAWQRIDPLAILDFATVSRNKMDPRVLQRPVHA
jgi:uncharacterized delta-60 repeat protein